jgi:transcriptional regulator with GAF, ATPase, and Fis domain
MKTLEDATRDHILQTLHDTKWVVGGRQGAAARLGIARTTLLSKMRRLGIEAAADGLRNRNAGRQALASFA